MITAIRNGLNPAVPQIIQTRGRGATGATKSYFAPLIENINDLVTYIGLDGSIATLQAVVRAFGREATVKANEVHGPLTDANRSQWEATYQEHITKATDGATTKAKLIEEYNKLTRLIVAIAQSAATGATSVKLEDGTEYTIPQIEGQIPVMSAMNHLAELSAKSTRLQLEIEKKTKTRKSDDDDDDDDDSAE